LKKTLAGRGRRGGLETIRSTKERSIAPTFHPDLELLKGTGGVKRISLVRENDERRTKSLRLLLIKSVGGDGAFPLEKREKTDLPEGRGWIGTEEAGGGATSG